MCAAEENEASLHDSWGEVEAQENHEWLLGEYARGLLCLEPASVLDIGCGSGGLLRAVRNAGVACSGLDQAGPRLDALREEGFEVREGTAYELPFADRSFDWISMRHVPHHLERPGPALAEALRVARRGLWIAEPWFDGSVPSQRSARALDVWEKRQHRRGGMFHAEVLELQQLLQLLPRNQAGLLRVEAHTMLRPRARSVTAFEREAQSLLADLPPGDSEFGAWSELLEELRRTGLSWNGSLCLCVRRADV